MTQKYPDLVDRKQSDNKRLSKKTISIAHREKERERKWEGLGRGEERNKVRGSREKERQGRGKERGGSENQRDGTELLVQILQVSESITSGNLEWELLQLWFK